MNYRENIRYFIVFGLVFFIIYIFIAVKPLTTEIQFTNISSTPLEEITISDLLAHNKAGDIYPFRLKNWAGYFSEEGEILFSTKIPFKATLTDNYWALYNQDTSEISVFKTDGTLQTKIKESGYPFFKDDRFFVFLPGGSSVAEFSKEGIRKWIHEDIYPITSFNFSSTDVVIGFANGKITVLSSDGLEKFSFFPGGSEYEVILGSNIAPEQNLIASVSGINRQRFTLSRFDGSQHKIIFHEYLNTNFKQQAFVQFSSDSQTAFFQYKGGIGIVDCKKTSCIHIPIKGNICQLEELENLKLTAILSHEKDMYYLYFLENRQNLVHSFSFNAESAFIKIVNSDIYIGKDDSFSKIKISRD